MEGIFQRGFSIIIIISMLIVTTTTSVTAQSEMPDVIVQPQSTHRDVVNLSVPYVHQVFDTADDFNGHCACGPTSAVMALAYFQKIPPNSMTVNAGGRHTTDYGRYVSEEYEANGHRFNERQSLCGTSSGTRPAAWGSTTIGGLAYAYKVESYLRRHGIDVEFSDRNSTSVEQDKAALRQALDQGFPVIVSTTMKRLEHIVLVRGYTDDNYFILNDPYGSPNATNYTSGNSRDGENVRVRFPSPEWTRIKWFIIVKGQGGTNGPRRDTDDNRRFSNFGQTFNGNLAPNTDDDIYSFNGNAGTSVKINMNATSGGLDTFLELYKPDGRLLAHNDDSNGGLNSEIQVSLPTTGDYKIIAHSYNRASGGSYNISFNGSAPATDTDDGRWLSSSGSLPGTVTPNSDYDTYFFNGSAGSVISLRMNKLDSSLDSWLELYHPSGTLLTFNDDGGGNRNSLIAYRLPVSGSYRVAARSYNRSSSGRYNISLQPERNNYALSLASDTSSQADPSISPAYATDGDASTAWSSGEAMTQRLTLDLGEMRTINQAIISWGGGDYASGYGLYYQDANGTWQPLFATDSGDGDVDVLEFAPVPVRYVLVEMWERPELSSQYSINEFEVHNTDSVLIPLVPPDDTDKAEETNVTPLVPLAPNPEGKEAAAFALGAGQESFPLFDADATAHTPSIQITDTYRFPTATLSLSGNLLLPGSSLTAVAINPHDQDSQQIGTGIIAYRWILVPTEIGPSGGFVIPVGDQPMLVLSSNEKLEPGQYYLQLEVQDDEGSWSQPVGQLITIGWNVYLPVITNR